MMPAGIGGTPRLAASSARTAFTSRSSSSVAIMGNMTLTLPKADARRIARKLSAQDLGAVEADSHTAFAEERIVFLRNRQVDQRLVASDIQRTNDERTIGAHGLSDGLVGLELLLFGRRIGAFHEEEFGAQQPHSFTAEAADLRGILESADVGEDLNACAVEGDGGFERMLEVFLAGAVRNAPAPGGCGPLLPETRAAAACPCCRRE